MIRDRKRMRVEEGLRHDELLRKRRMNRKQRDKRDRDNDNSSDDGSRARRIKKRAKLLGRGLLVFVTQSPTVSESCRAVMKAKEVLSHECADRLKWFDAIKAERDKLFKFGAVTKMSLADLVREGIKDRPVGSMLILTDNDVRKKARIVVLVNQQTTKVNAFSSVVSYTTLRLFLSLGLRKWGDKIYPTSGRHERIFAERA
jgi:hypothetical protein